MGHGHGHGVTAVSASARYLNRLWAALALGCVFLAIEVVIGVTTSSLALLADAAHMFTDVIGTGMALGAVLLAMRASAERNRTFGFYRAEVLAALANAVLLFAVAGYILVEAIGRFQNPADVPGLPVTVTAMVGIGVNITAFSLLRSGAKESLNIRGAYLEVLADLIGSLGVLVSGLLTLLFGWRYADPIIAVAIGLFVLPRTWGLARRAVRILFQHAPDRVDVDKLKADLAGLPNVAGVHDLHVWTLTSGMEVASAHVTVQPGADQARVLASAQRLLATDYHLEHATIQVESAGSVAKCQELNW